MEHHVIEKMSLDYQQDSEEACYKLLVHWINNYPDCMYSECVPFCVAPFWFWR